MLIKQGIDIVRNKRILNDYQTLGEKFLNRFLSEREKNLFYAETFLRKEGYKEMDKSTLHLHLDKESIRFKKRVGEYLAVRWAAKEAVLKVFGFNVTSHLSLPEIEVLYNDQKCPLLVFSGRGEKFVNQLKLNKWHLSLSHERDYSVASVLAYTQSEIKE